MTNPSYDVLVMGSGPGGEGAAMKLVKSGKRVALVEAYHQIGGGCTHWGTIPSKTLRHTIQMIADYRRHPLFEQVVHQMQFSYPQLLSSAKSVMQGQSKMRHRFYARNQVDIFQGRGCLLDANTVEVLLSGGVQERISAEYIIIATGSRPYRPTDLDFSHPAVCDSDTLLQLNHTPRSVTVYGAGVIGCEYASIFAHLDVKVNLVNARDRLLAFLDDEITDALSYYLRYQGVVIRHNEVYEKVELHKDGVILYCRSGKRFKTDILLWANGRSGNTQNMGLEALGIAINHRGQIEVNERYQTSLEHIYAVGDVAGPPALASASYDQGRYAGTHIVEGSCDCRLVRHIPTGIFTSPEISSIGLTERELTEQKVPYEIGRADFRNLARAQITNHRVGMLKLLFHRDNLELLGIHCFGEQASEIVHIGQAIMAQPGAGNTLRYFVETTFNYPTMAEAYRVAALNGLNRLF